jgi:hypothetical protein
MLSAGAQEGNKKSRRPGFLVVRKKRTQERDQRLRTTKHANFSPKLSRLNNDSRELAPMLSCGQPGFKKGRRVEDRSCRMQSSKRGKTHKTKASHVEHTPAHLADRGGRRELRKASINVLGVRDKSLPGRCACRS